VRSSSKAVYKWTPGKIKLQAKSAVKSALSVKTCNSSIAKLLAAVVAPTKEVMTVATEATAHLRRLLSKDAPWLAVAVVAISGLRHSSARKHSLNVRLQPMRMTSVKARSRMVWMVTTFHFDGSSCVLIAQ
jgi:hypothetical protein